ncbi:MAG: AMP-binding protein [Gemmatimonadetes bacterium]|nr:AMP-binding protein [Gemmatimonadota bacterium]
MTKHSGALTAHVDTFAAGGLPRRALLPILDHSGVPELAYPDRLNCAVELLDAQIAAGLGDQPVLHSPELSWTYRELAERVHRIARVLVEDLGLVPGNRVLLRGPNHPMLAACWLAVLEAGGICVTTMPLLRARELAVLCDKARIALALTDVRLAAEIETAAASTDALRRIVHFNAPAQPGSLEFMMRDKPASFDAVPTAATDIAILAFTSGTTGTPKATMHTHRDLLAVCDTFSRYILRPARSDIFAGSPPLGFTFGLGALLLFPMRAGASALLLEDASPPKLLEGIARHGATICSTAPTAYRAMAGLAGGHDLARLRMGISAGETLPRATFERWESATGMRLIDGIGATEMLHIFIASPGHEVRAGSTGRVVPGYRARIVDDDGHEVPRGEIGRLAVIGPTGCRYLDDEVRQRSYVRHGWNQTGDAFVQDEDGYFWYQARTDDMIISAGYNIAGPEVENVLLEHPAVQECGVVGLPDEERGQIVAAFVVLRAGADADAETAKRLQEHVKAAIAPYKYPRRVVFLDRLPRTQTGKLQRFRLREEHS